MEDYPSDWDTRRREVYERDDYTCKNCGVKGGPRGDAELHAHHVVPKSSGGTHDPSNLTTVCSDCHQSIHNDVMAPTAGVTESSSFGGESPADKFANLNLSLGGVSFYCERDGPSHAPIVAYFYAGKVFGDAATELLQFANHNETAPSRLRERYEVAVDVCRQVLGLGSKAGRYSFSELMEHTDPEDRMPPEFIKKLTQFDNLGTIHSVIDEWERQSRDDAPPEFDRFIRLSKDLEERWTEFFQARLDFMEIDENGYVQYSASKATMWEIKDLGDEVEHLERRWANILSDLSSEALESELREQQTGCFLATAAMGTTAAPELDALRGFRDEILKQRFIGRLFVRFYYRVSPPIAAWIARSERRRRVVRRCIIRPAVSFVQALD